MEDKFDFAILGTIWFGKSLYSIAFPNRWEVFWAWKTDKLMDGGEVVVGQYCVWYRMLNIITHEKYLKFLFIFESFWYFLCFPFRYGIVNFLYIIF